MTPYASFSYFGILLLVVVIPTIVLGLLGKKPKGWLVVATAAMLAVQYAWPVVGRPESPFWHELATLVIFAAFQCVVALGYGALRARENHKRWFPAFPVLALSPMIFSKLLPFDQGGSLIGFVGISYLSFRSIDVLICLRDGTIRDLSSSTFLMFLLFFPTVSSGPLDRYRRFEADWHAPRTASKFLDDLDHAVSCFFTGLLYKFVFSAIIYDRWLGATKDSHEFLPMLSYMYAGTVSICSLILPDTARLQSHSATSWASEHLPIFISLFSRPTSRRSGTAGISRFRTGCVITFS